MKNWNGAQMKAAQPEPEVKPRRARKPSAQKLLETGERVTEHIYLCADGKYRWIHALNLYRNPSIYLLVWKIFFFIFLAVFSVVLISDAANWGAAKLLEDLRFLACFLIGMTALTGLGYLLYALIMGGSYRVIFETDEQGVNHRQMPAQAKKARALGRAAFLAGTAGGSFGAMSAGMSAQRTEMYTEFARVRKLKCYPRRGLIKLNERLSHNQVYAAPEDFPFVADFILQHCHHLK